MSDEVPFGKYKGRPVADMLADASYIAWLEGQPWFRDRFAHLLAMRDQDAMSRTPTHNRLQAKFLDNLYCMAFVQCAIPESYHQTMTSAAKAGIALTHKTRVEFETHNCDVYIQWQPHTVAGVYYPPDYVNYFDSLGLRVEIKPSVSDEYPAILRQMKRNQSHYLFCGSYKGEGATRLEFVQIFAASGLVVVFKDDVDFVFNSLSHQ